MDFFLFKDNLRIQLTIYIYFVWLFFFHSCQLFYFYGPLSSNSLITNRTSKHPGRAALLINSSSSRPQDWSIPGRTRQGHISSPLHSRPSLRSDKKSPTHTTAVCPSTRSINVSGPLAQSFSRGRTGIWSITIPLPRHRRTHPTRYGNDRRRVYTPVRASFGLPP